jgi:hypothetical protein
MGMDISVVNWILGCVQTISFTVLVNSAPSRFFRASRGLRECFLLASFMFLIVVKALSKVIEDARIK